MENKNLNDEIIRLKKVNNRNSAMIIALLVILLFVCVIAVWIRF
mgnify:CR=1 FL=1